MQVFELFQVPLLINIVHATAAVLKKNKQKRLLLPQLTLNKIWVNGMKQKTARKSLYICLMNVPLPFDTWILLKGKLRLLDSMELHPQDMHCVGCEVDYFWRLIAFCENFIKLTFQFRRGFKVCSRKNVRWLLKSTKITTDKRASCK